MSRRIEMEELLAHADWLRRLAGGLVRDSASADDLVQDTWVAALRRPPGAEPRPWLARVAHNLARNARRASARRVTHEGLAHEERASTTPADGPFYDGDADDQVELGATQYWERSTGPGRDSTNRVVFGPRADEPCLLVGLRPGVPLSIEQRDASGKPLAVRNLTLAAGEWARLEILLRR